MGVDPEAVLLKSGLDSSTAAAFLHENMLEFVDAEAMDEAAGAYSYLSHAGADTQCTYHVTQLPGCLLMHTS